MTRLISIAALAAASVLGAACGETAPPAVPACSLSVAWTGIPHRVAVHAETNLAGGSVVNAEMYGNGVLVDQDSETLAGSGSLDEIVDIPQYGFTVVYEGRVLYAGSLLCSTTYVDFTGPIPEDWTPAPGTTYGF